MAERVVVANRHEDAARSDVDASLADVFRREQLELIELRGVRAAARGGALRRDEARVQDQREGDAGNRRDLLREQVDDRHAEERQGDQHEADRELDAADLHVQRHSPFTVSRLRVAKDQHRQRLEREAPDDAEGVGLAEQVHVAAAEHDRQHLQADDRVDDAVVGAEAAVWLPEPRRQHSVLRDAAQYPARSDDRRVDGARQNQEPDEDDERLKDQPQPHRSGKVHRQPGDQVVVELRPHAVGNERHREEAHERGEQQAVDENHQAGALEVLHLRLLDLAVNLRERFLAAHREDRVAEADEDGDRRERRPPRSFQPAERIVGETQVARDRRRRPPAAVHQQGRRAPGDEDHDHHRRDLHDLERVVARLVQALGVAPPEIHGDEDREQRRRLVVRDPGDGAEPPEQVVDQAGDVLARRHAADRASQDVIEQQRRDRQLRHRRPHRFLDDAIDAAADEHRGALDVHGAHRVREEHDAEDEPGRRLADRLLRDAADVVRGGSEIGQDDRGRAPERDEGQENGGGENDLDALRGESRRVSHVH